MVGHVEVGARQAAGEGDEVGVIVCARKRGHYGGRCENKRKLWADVGGGGPGKASAGEEGFAEERDACL